MGAQCFAIHYSQYNDFSMVIRPYSTTRGSSLKSRFFDYRVDGLYRSGVMKW